MSSTADLEQTADGRACKAQTRMLIPLVLRRHGQSIAAGYGRAMAALVGILACLTVASCAPAGVGHVPLETPRAYPTEPRPSTLAVVVYRAPVFQFFGPDGSLLEERPADGMESPRAGTAQVVGSSVYYLDSHRHVVRRVTAKGSQDLDLTMHPGLSSFLMSSDGAQLAWATAEFGEAIVSELWMAHLDGSNPRLVERSDPSRPELTSFVLQPYRWTADGDLVYAWQPIGLGGYVLFEGYASFYRYSPPASRTTPILPVTVLTPGTCWNALSQNLVLAAGTCGGAQDPISMRLLTLGTGSEVVVPVVAEQGIAGSAAFSPDGQRLAYAVARNNPENEAGQVLLVDLAPGSQPISLASTPGGYYHHLAWLDDNRLVAGASLGGVDRVVLLTLGSGELPLAEGLLVGLQIP